MYYKFAASVCLLGKSVVAKWVYKTWSNGDNVCIVQYKGPLREMIYLGNEPTFYFNMFKICCAILGRF